MTKQQASTLTRDNINVTTLFMVKYDQLTDKYSVVEGLFSGKPFGNGALLSINNFKDVNACRFFHFTRAKAIAQAKRYNRAVALYDL